MRSSWLSRLAGCFGPGLASLAVAAGPVQRAPVQPVPPLRISTVELRDVPAWWPAEALVEAARQATIEAQVGGRISELRVDAGQAVHRGQILARIEDRESGTAVGVREARLQQAEAALVNAKAQYERAARIRQTNPDALSESAFEEARARYDTARSAQRAAHAERALAVVVAPFDGIIERRFLSVGEVAAPGKALLSLYDPAALRLVADVPQDRVAALQSRSRARVDLCFQVELCVRGQFIDAGRIEFLPAADSNTGTVRARLYLPDRIPGLRPGGFARVDFAMGEERILSIADEAVLRRGEITAAYVLKADGSLALRQIRLGSTIDAARVEVLAGLAAGDVVASRPVEIGILRPPAP